MFKEILKQLGGVPSSRRQRVKSILIDLSQPLTQEQLKILYLLLTASHQMELKAGTYVLDFGSDAHKVTYKVEVKHSLIRSTFNGEQLYVVESEKLGKGGFGTVYVSRKMVQLTTDGVQIVNCEKEKAIKIILSSDNEWCKAKLSEIGNEWKIADGFYGQLEQVIVTKDRAYMIFDRFPGEDLFSWLEKGQDFSGREVLHIFQQVLMQIKKLHQGGQGSVHRDVKLENVLYDPMTDTVTLIDFGVAMPLIQPDGKVSGSPMYMAPEVLKGKAECASDIYSLGVLLLELCLPDSSYNDCYIILKDQACEDLKAGKEKGLLELQEEYRLKVPEIELSGLPSDEVKKFKDVLLMMLNPFAFIRPSVDELIRFADSMQQRLISSPAVGTSCR
jgi:serine/threonine protein kinase